MKVRVNNNYCEQCRLFSGQARILNGVVSWGLYIDSAAYIGTQTTAISMGIVPQKKFDFEVPGDIYIDVIRAKIS